MQDDFWSKNGRKDWYEPEPNSKIFLARFFVELGKIRHGTSWHGAVKKPSSASALPLMREIAQAAASGLIKTLVLNPKTFDFQPIASAGWRNPKALAARFSRCRIDAADPVSSAAEGGHHGPIYIERDSGLAYLAAVQSAAPRPTSSIKLDHLSTYLRFMIFVAQQQKIDENNPPPRKALVSTLIEEWESWRSAQSDVMHLPPDAIVTHTLATNMATILRGEKARAEKSGDRIK